MAGGGAARRRRSRPVPTRGTASTTRRPSWYDVDGDTRDQAYGGVGVEDRRTTEAIEATAGEVIVDSTGHAIFAQYASADGGWTVSGGESLPPGEGRPVRRRGAQHRPRLDEVGVGCSTIAAAYPKLGTLSDIEITGRDGHGAWGGRVTTLKLVGSKATVALSGTDLQSTLGFGSPWFRPTPTAGRTVEADGDGGWADGDREVAGAGLGERRGRGDRLPVHPVAGRAQADADGDGVDGLGGEARGRHVHGDRGRAEQGRQRPAGHSNNRH